MSGATREHWLDRLAAPRTRRQVLQAALAGAALTLPFARPARTHAADQIGRTSAGGPCNVGKSQDPHACRQGCLRTSDLATQRSLDACLHTAGGQVALLGYLAPGVGFFLVSGAFLSSSTSAYVCTEVALVRQKAMQYDCLQPNCPGFDPCGKDGPCESCSKIGGWCCPDPTTLTGYSCCACCGPDPRLACSGC
jgi:hypothetical protein